VKRIILVVFATLMFLNDLAVPRIARADGGPPPETCGSGPICKP
jgi:hypothetical protein